MIFDIIKVPLDTGPKDNYRDWGIHDYVKLWLGTDQGKWVKENCHLYTYRYELSWDTFSYTLIIYGDVSEEQETFYKLRFK